MARQLTFKIYHKNDDEIQIKNGRKIQKWIRRVHRKPHNWECATGCQLYQAGTWQELIPVLEAHLSADYSAFEPTVVKIVGKGL